MLCCSVISVPAFIVACVRYPAASALCLVPAAAVLLVVAWVDRVEPEPGADRIHAFLFGACVAALLAGIVNTLVYLTAGPLPALVVSAPIGEEVLKGFGVYWVTRRGQLRTALDGVIYAGLVAAGFALAENVEYFTAAAADGTLPAVFVARGLLTPFAHPLFTLWTGISMGIAARRGGRAVLRWAGLPVAVALHATWNYAAWLDAERPTQDGVDVVVVFFVALFLATGIGIVLARLASIRRQRNGIGAVVLTHNLTPVEYATFTSYRTTRRARRAVPRRARRSFDAWHTSVLRLIDAGDDGQEADLAVLVASVAATRDAVHSAVFNG